MDTQAIDRDALAPGEVFEGPAIIEEPTATTLVHPGESLEVDRFGNLVIAIETEG